MREIKFRLWDTGYNKFVPQNVYAVNGDKRQVAICIKDWETVQRGEIWYDHQCILMQFTGLKDKNGKEIYEGDILGLVWEEIDEAGSTHWESIHEVIWGGIDYPAFDLKPNLYCEENSLSHLACSPEAPYFEVIGNKFENQELIND